MREKVDVLQGIAGILWILTWFFASGVYPPITFFPTGEVGIIEWKVIFMWIIIPTILGSIIVMLREERGIDLFGILSILLGFTGFLIQQFYHLIPLYQLWAMLIPPFLGIGLILEAFDIIKPIKV